MMVASGGIAWTRVRVPRILSRVGLGSWVLGALFGAVSDFAGGFHAWDLYMSLQLLAWPLVILSYVISLTQLWATGAVEVQNDVLVVRGRRIRLSAIASALVVERTVGGGRIATVEVELANGDRVAIRVPDAATARALVERLGFGPNGRRARMSFAMPSRRLVHPLLGVVAYAFSFIALLGIEVGMSVRWGFAAPTALQPMVAVGIYALLRFLTHIPIVTVGDDGVVVERAKRRFFPRREIAAVSRVRDAPLVIGLRDGSKVFVGGVNVDWDRLDAVGRLIEARHGPSTAAPEKFAAFDRSGSSLAEWRERIRVAMDGGGYRDLGASIDDAAEVVRSPHATPEQRVGAAIALRIANEPQRIRIAADAVVDPDVRRALEAIAGDDEPHAEKALRRLSR